MLFRGQGVKEVENITLLLQGAGGRKGRHLLAGELQANRPLTVPE